MPAGLPSLPLLWLYAALLGLGGYLLCQRHPRTGLVLVPVAALLGLLQHVRLLDPVVGAAVVRHVGETYIWQAHVAHAITIGGPLLGVLLGRRRERATALHAEG